MEFMNLGSMLSPASLSAGKRGDGIESNLFPPSGGAALEGAAFGETFDRELNPDARGGPARQANGRTSQDPGRPFQGPADPDAVDGQPAANKQLVPPLPEPESLGHGAFGSVGDPEENGTPIPTDNAEDGIRVGPVLHQEDPSPFAGMRDNGRFTEVREPARESPLPLARGVSEGDSPDPSTRNARPPMPLPVPRVAEVAPRAESGQQVPREPSGLSSPAPVPGASPEDARPVIPPAPPAEGAMAARFTPPVAADPAPQPGTRVDPPTGVPGEAASGPDARAQPSGAVSAKASATAAPAGVPAPRPPLQSQPAGTESRPIQPEPRVLAEPGRILSRNESRQPVFREIPAPVNPDARTAGQRLFTDSPAASQPVPVASGREKPSALPNATSNDPTPVLQRGDPSLRQAAPLSPNGPSGNATQAGPSPLFQSAGTEILNQPLPKADPVRELRERATQSADNSRDMRRESQADSLRHAETRPASPLPLPTEARDSLAPPRPGSGFAESPASGSRENREGRSGRERRERADRESAASIRTDKGAGPGSPPPGAPRVSIAPVSTSSQESFSRMLAAVERMQATRTESRVQLNLKMESGEDLKVLLKLARGHLQTLFLTDSEGLRGAMRDGWDQFQRHLLDRGVHAELPDFQHHRQDGSAHEERQVWEAFQEWTSGNSPRGLRAPSRDNPPASPASGESAPRRALDAWA